MRPTRRKRSLDPLMMKAEIIAGHLPGKLLYDVWCAALQARGVRCPKWEGLDDVNVLLAVKEAAAFWGGKPYGPDVIVQTYLREFTAPLVMAKFQSLTGTRRAHLLETIQRDQKNARSAMCLGTASTIIEEADKTCQDLQLEMVVESQLDYVRATLKAWTGSRNMTPAGNAFLSGVIGNIPAWARCFMSGNDPAVLQAHGHTASREHIMTPALRVYLQRMYNYNSLPVLSLPPSPA